MVRYRIARLLIVTVAATAIFAAYRSWDRGTALERAVDQAGGAVWSEYTFPLIGGSPHPADAIRVVLIDLGNGSASCEEIKHIVELVAQRRQGPIGFLLPLGVDNDSVRSVIKAPRLELLWLASDDISHDTIDEIASSRSLRSLRISGTNVDDHALAKLADIPTLADLFVNGSYTEQGLESTREAYPDLRIETD